MAATIAMANCDGNAPFAKGDFYVEHICANIGDSMPSTVKAFERYHIKSERQNLHTIRKIKTKSKSKAFHR